MKTTADYLHEMVTELGTVDFTKLTDFQTMTKLAEIYTKYAILIDAVKILKQ